MMIVNRVSRDEFLKYLSKKPKYHNKKTDLGRGEFQSKKEALYEKELFLKKRSGLIKDYWIQERIKLVVNDIYIADYIMDFVVLHNNNKYEYIETKGYKTDLWKLKWKLVKALYPNDVFILV